MRQKIYQIDAFTNWTFGGNPAAVCILNSWLSPELMQKIAQENNLAETAFAVKKDEQYEIRWFTPEVEVDLCGHATLATALCCFTFMNLTKIPFSFIHHAVETSALTRLIMVGLPWISQQTT